MIIRSPRDILTARLHRVSEEITSCPDSIDLRFERAVLLRELGQTQESIHAYLDLLSRDPQHFGALNNLGTLAMETGHQTAARTAYTEAIKHHPRNPMAHVNLANLLSRIDEFEAAHEHYNISLGLDPSHADAHQGLARLLSEQGREEDARAHRIQGFENRPIKIVPFRGPGSPIQLLVLAAAEGGAVPIWQHLDDQIFATTVLYVDFFPSTAPLPAHDLIFNAIGDADHCSDSLNAAATLLEQTSSRVINLPGHVLRTGRAENARRFAEIQNLVTPRMVRLSRRQLETTNASSILTAHGIGYPLLVRSLGFHNGSFFSRIEDEQNLSRELPQVPGDEMLFIQFLNARGPDGNTRKYRVMMIDGQLFPLHVAISPNWKIHFFSADMVANARNRAEDEAFLHDMPNVLGQRAMSALQQIKSMLDLDYAGIDFGLNQDGDLILFEANACMVVNPPDAEPIWDYRRPAVGRILSAIRTLLTRDISSSAS